MTAILTPGANIQTNISSDTAQKMAVDMSGLAHIMSVLTNLYSNPSLAVLREYSVNALDSHVEAGETRPIEVTLPSDLNPVLTIKDYGVGMSEADIYCIYAQYGASTKRADETQVGGFGLGCKSALALTQQFTVTAIKDGRKTVVYFAQGSDGVGTVDTLLRSSTEEPNGVEVSIPVSDVNAMIRESEDFFAVWKQDTVLVNGQAPESVWNSAIQIAEGVYMLPENPTMPFASRRLRQKPNILAMGSVSYPLDPQVLQDIIRPLNNRFSAHSSDIRMFINVDIGEVDITPSRETLNYSDRTKAVLQSKMEAFFENIKIVASNYVSEAATPVEALNRTTSWRSKYWLSGVEYIWNGHTIPGTILLKNAINQINFANGSRTATIYGATHLTVPVDGTRLMIHGVSTEEQRLRASRDIRDYVKGVNGSLQAGIALFTDPGTVFDDNIWLADVDGGIFTHVTIEVLMDRAREYRRSIRRANTASSGGRVSATAMSYPVLDKTSNINGLVTSMSVAELLSSKASLFYYSSNGLRFTEDYMRTEAIKTFFVDMLPAQSILIFVEGARTSSGLLRRIPQASQIGDRYASMAKRFVHSLTPVERQIIAADTMDTRMAARAIETLRPYTDQIKNQNFLAIMQALHTATDNAEANAKRSQLRFFERYAHLNRDAYSQIIAPEFGNSGSILGGYPLLGDALSSRHPGASEIVIQHAIAYLNVIA